MKNAKREKQLKTFVTTVTLKRTDTTEWKTFDMQFVMYAYDLAEAEERIERDLYSEKYKNTKYDSRNIVRISKVQLLSKELFETLNEVEI